MFGRLELEVGAGVVWEKNTVTWLVAGGWSWSDVRGKNCSAGELETSRTQWIRDDSRHNREKKKVFRMYTLAAGLPTGRQYIIQQLRDPYQLFIGSDCIIIIPTLTELPVQPIIFWILQKNGRSYNPFLTCKRKKWDGKIAVGQFAVCLKFLKSKRCKVSAGNPVRGSPCSRWPN